MREIKPILAHKKDENWVAFQESISWKNDKESECKFDYKLPLDKYKEIFDQINPTEFDICRIMIVVDSVEVSNNLDTDTVLVRFTDEMVTRLDIAPNRLSTNSTFVHEPQVCVKFPENEDFFWFKIKKMFAEIVWTEKEKYIRIWGGFPLPFEIDSVVFYGKLIVEHAVKSKGTPLNRKFWDYYHFEDFNNNRAKRSAIKYNYSYDDKFISFNTTLVHVICGETIAYYFDKSGYGPNISINKVNPFEIFVHLAFGKVVLIRFVFLDKETILTDNNLVEFFDSFDYFVNGKETRDKILEAVPELKPLIESKKKPDAIASVDSDGVTIKIPKPSIDV